MSRNKVSTRGLTPFERPALEEFSYHIDKINYGILDELIGYYIRRAQIAIYIDFFRTVSGSAITPPLFAAIVLIKQNPGINQVTLAKVMGIARSGVLLLINRLDEMGWVERHHDPANRRIKQLSLTAQGYEETLRLEQLIKEHDARISKRLSPHDLEVLRELLNRFEKIEPDQRAAQQSHIRLKSSV
jgi:DNA-binding MarR family transcriptional regulator